MVSTVNQVEQKISISISTLFSNFFHFFLVGVHQQPALQDEGSTQNVGSLEEIKEVNLKPRFLPYFQLLKAVVLIPPLTPRGVKYQGFISRKVRFPKFFT